MTYTTDLLQSTFSALKSQAQSAPFPSLQERKNALDNLQQAVIKYEQSLLEALHHDFGTRAKEESRLIELMPLFGEIKHAKRHVRRWMKPIKRQVHISALPAKAKVLSQPKGVIGVISPWNYPVLLSLGPLVGALAAGNRVMIKVSEFCPETNQILKRLLSEALGSEWVEVIEGEAEIANAFSQLPFDHILFTGSTNIGRIVMENAAHNLTPVTLELGGKSPLLIATSADLEDTARKLVFGKVMNAGQTCVAPDYVFCHQDQKHDLIEYMRQELAKCYPQGVSSPDYTSIINDRQLARLKGYIEEANTVGSVCENLMATEDIEADGKLALHIIHQPKLDSTVMRDEIFGPVLPILTYEEMSEALDYIREQPRPLAMYLFTKHSQDQQYCEENIVSGSFVVNHTLIQVAQSDLPFGGVGPSGMGAYHAEEGFRTFSHNKAVLIKKNINTLSLLRPPYTRKIHKLVAKYWRFL